MIDCQQETAHLSSMGGSPIPRDEFLNHVREKTTAINPVWSFNKGVLQHWLSQPA
jgi:leucyl/phenylalanyl-tRNA--protein transferase